MTGIDTINRTTLDLPDSANPATWTGEQAALMEFAGLVKVTERMVPNPDAAEGQPRMIPEKVKTYAPPAIAQAFVAAVKRSGLDPFARQVYAAELGGKWVILSAIDGFRAVAESSREYEGRTPIEYTADGKEWVEAWLPELMGLEKNAKPAAARVGIYRRGFRDAVYTTVTWKEFGSDRNQWAKMPAWMLGIRVLSHAYRDAFPQKLSGLYTREDFDGEADNADRERELLAEVEKLETEEAVNLFFSDHDEEDISTKIRRALMARAGIIRAQAEARRVRITDENGEEVVEATVEPDEPPTEATPELSEEEYERLAAEDFARQAAQS